MYGYTEHDSYTADDGELIRSTADGVIADNSAIHSNLTWPTVDAVAVDASVVYYAARALWCEEYDGYLMRSTLSEPVGPGMILLGEDWGGMVDKHAFV